MTRRHDRRVVWLKAGGGYARLTVQSFVRQAAGAGVPGAAVDARAAIEARIRRARAADDRRVHLLQARASLVAGWARAPVAVDVILTQAAVTTRHRQAFVDLDLTHHAFVAAVRAVAYVRDRAVIDACAETARVLTAGARRAGSHTHRHARVGRLSFARNTLKAEIARIR